MKVRPNSGAGPSLMSGLRKAVHSVPYLLFALCFVSSRGQQTDSSGNHITEPAETVDGCQHGSLYTFCVSVGSRERPIDCHIQRC